MNTYPGQGPSDETSPPQSGSIRTLADVLARLEAVRSRERRQVEIRSAIRGMGELLRCPLTDIPADPAELRRLIAGATRASIGMTKQRCSRVRSLTLAALRDVGVDVMPGRDVASASPAWKRLLGVLPTQTMRVGLSRFASHCTRLGVEPVDVAAATFSEFSTALQKRSLKQKPDAIYRGAVRRWNLAAETLDGPRSRSRSNSMSGSTRCRGPTSQPASSWTSRPTSRSRPTRTSSTSSRMASRVLRNRAPWRCGGKLRQLASVLVGSGVCIEDLTSLAVLFRDGLMIALLVQRPFRVANFTTITLDRHLQKRGDVWWLCFDASETKGDNAIECRWPEGLVEGLERYLDIHRQRLLRNPSAATPATPALWISQQGRPMSSAAVEAQIGDRTRETFGKPINPHAFRHIAATMIATSNPEGAADIMAVLGHVSMATSEKYYNRATMIAAGNSVQATIAELRGQG